MMTSVSILVILVYRQRLSKERLKNNHALDAYCLQHHCHPANHVERCLYVLRRSAGLTIGGHSQHVRV